MRKQKTFLLKLWNDSATKDNWRASLEDVQTKDKQYFADLALILESLYDMANEVEDTPQEDCV